jgi:hypothetical protein
MRDHLPDLRVEDGEGKQTEKKQRVFHETEEQS